MNWKFKVGDMVLTYYNGPAEILIVTKHINQPVEYEGVMPNLYVLSNGQVLKEHHLQCAPTGATATEFRRKA